jgi:ATP-dependent phosphofructokinase / diphosphate-dependent phosphofructokinase
MNASAQYGYCTVAVSEGLSDAEGKLIAESGTKDAFGHSQLGGVGQMVAQLVKDRLGYKYHWALADYLQRSARHWLRAPISNRRMPWAWPRSTWRFAGQKCRDGDHCRLADQPYRWEIGDAPLSQIANVERKMPPEFISADGFHITDACRAYLQPLIEGEDPPPFRNGLPDYVRLKNIAVTKKLGVFEV